MTSDKPDATVEDVEREASRYILHELGNRLWAGEPAYDEQSGGWTVAVHSRSLPPDVTLAVISLDARGVVVRAPTRRALQQAVERFESSAHWPTTPATTVRRPGDPPQPSAELLAILDSDPVAAEARYRELLRDLTRFLEWRRCVEPEEAAGEAIYRGLKRLAAGVNTSESGARAYFFGVARNVAYEEWKSRRREQQLDPAVWDRTPSRTRGHEEVEARLMLQDVLQRLDRHDRAIILRYCAEKDHSAHCHELGVTPGNLRVIVHRIRERIREMAGAALRTGGTRTVGEVDGNHS